MKGKQAKFRIAETANREITWWIGKERAGRRSSVPEVVDGGGRRKG